MAEEEVNWDPSTSQASGYHCVNVSISLGGIVGVCENAATLTAVLRALPAPELGMLVTDLFPPL